MVRMNAMEIKGGPEPQVKVHNIKFRKIVSFRIMNKITVNRKGLTYDGNEQRAHV